MKRRSLARIVLATAGMTGTLFIAAPAFAVPAPAPGPGTMTVSPSSPVLVSSTDNTLTFTYKAALAGVSRGTMKLVVPSGWTAPQKKKSHLPGFVSASKGKVAVSKFIVSVKKLTVCPGCTFTVTYNDATAPSASGVSTFTTASTAKGTKTSPLTSSPTVTVGTPPTAPDITSVTPGNDELTVQLTAPTAYPAVTDYTVTCGTQSTTIDDLTVTVIGLTNGTQYSCTAYATNAVGNGPDSTSSSGTPAQPTSQVPGAPTITGTAWGSHEVTVYFTPPKSPEAITGYVANCSSSNGSSSGTAGASAVSATVTSLINTVFYTCTIYATDAAGNGPTAPFSGYPGTGGG